ncbi:MAG: tyrosine-type recombinase/integrase, partial [Deltaproteobacteria bacterium]|nr:tyrosine-type recombinase/integrase [Deltaproteobacteria bacterium]
MHACRRDTINDRKSIDRARLSVTHLEGIFEGMRVTNITTPLIKKYIKQRKAENAKNATINRELAALKRMLIMGARSTPPKVDRVPFIPMLKESNVRQGFFEHPEYSAVKDALPDYLKGYVTFAYFIGWRKDEISSLTWSQVDRKNGIVRLEPGETKNDESRTVYLNDEL